MKRQSHSSALREPAASPDSSQSANPRTMYVPIELLLEPVIAARQTFDDVKFVELCDSLRSIGQLLPLHVEEEGPRYRIHAGHRRFEAGKVCGFTTMECKVWLPGTCTGEAIKSHENAFREDLNAAEEADYFARLLQGPAENDVDKLAEMVMQKVGYVQQRLGLIMGDSRVFEGLKAGVITIGVAQELNLIKHEGYRLQYLDVAARGGCSVRQMRDWRVQLNMQALPEPGAIVELLPDSPPPPPPAGHNPHCLFCSSADDQYEMEPIWAHKSCRRAAERTANSRLEAV